MQLCEPAEREGRQSLHQSQEQRRDSSRSWFESWNSFPGQTPCLPLSKTQMQLSRLAWWRAAQCCMLASQIMALWGLSLDITCSGALLCAHASMARKNAAWHLGTLRVQPLQDLQSRAEALIHSPSSQKHVQNGRGESRRTEQFGISLQRHLGDSAGTTPKLIWDGYFVHGSQPTFS